jgi:hypothetical protein
VTSKEIFDVKPIDRCAAIEPEMVAQWTQAGDLARPQGGAAANSASTVHKPPDHGPHFDTTGNRLSLLE